MTSLTYRHGRDQRPDRGVDDATQIGPLLNQVDHSVAVLPGDRAFDRSSVYADVQECHPEAAVIVPSRQDAVPRRPPRLRPPSAIAIFRRSTSGAGWLGSATVATIFGLAWSARSGAGSVSSATACASTPKRHRPPRSLSPSRSSTACSISDARTPSPSPERRHGKIFFLPLHLRATRRNALNRRVQ